MAELLLGTSDLLDYTGVSLVASDRRSLRGLVCIQGKSSSRRSPPHTEDLRSSVSPFGQTRSLICTLNTSASLTPHTRNNAADEGAAQLSFSSPGHVVE